MNFALPSLLDATNNWGAFLFFAAMCLLAEIYVFLMIPETAGISVEELDAVFEGPWFNAYKTSRKSRYLVAESIDVENQRYNSVLCRSLRALS
jgi:hypothetical protein